MDYLAYLADTAHTLVLAIGLKNTGTILKSVLPMFDFSITESCVQYDKCAVYQPFVAAGKPVFNIEYPFDGDTNEDSKTTVSTAGLSNYCSASGTAGTSVLLKHTSLDGWSYQC